MLNKEYKLIAIDIDGTLITSRYSISPRTLRALREAMRAGIKVTIATGRFYMSSLRLAKKLPINAPLICNDGAQIVDVHSGDSIFYRPLQMDIARKVLDICADYSSLRVQIFMEDHKVYVGRNFQLGQVIWYLKMKHHLRGFVNYLKDFVFVPVNNAGDFEKAKFAMKGLPAKIVICGEPGEMRQLKKRLATLFGDNIFITTAIKNCVDILDGSVSKAKGLRVLAERYGFKRDEIIAIGDNINDLPMLEYAGLGVAMGNAPKPVKERADVVTAGNNEDGIAILLEKVLGGMIRPKGNKHLIKPGMPKDIKVDQ
ncbi:MAG: HAD family phosphatase [Thermoanaerobacterales bacterium]|jgi:Cof subfamily protein (haloacid dehalogenase superfamily)|nr:HAD family phosphatase [Thermoanaerobacterales bacterium]